LIGWFRYRVFVAGWLEVVEETDEREGAGEDVVAIVEPNAEEESDP
jgi:hypothetical protein